MPPGGGFSEREKGENKEYREQTRNGTTIFSSGQRARAPPGADSASAKREKIKSPVSVKNQGKKSGDGSMIGLFYTKSRP